MKVFKPINVLFIVMLTTGLVACSSEAPDPEALAAEQTRNAELLGTYQANQQIETNGQTDAWVPNSTPIPTNSTVSLGGAEETPLTRCKPNALQHSRPLSLLSLTAHRLPPSQLL